MSRYTPQPASSTAISTAQPRHGTRGRDGPPTGGAVTSIETRASPGRRRRLGGRPRANVVIYRMEQNRLLPRRCHGPPAGTCAPPLKVANPPISREDPCARLDSNHHGENSPQGPQPRRRPPDAYRSVRIVQIGRLRGRIRRIWDGGCCHDVATRRPPQRGSIFRRLAPTPGHSQMSSWHRP